MSEQVRIIDNRKVLMTDEEFSTYQQICSSYDEPPHQHGKDLFQGLFESDEQGLIIYLRPPTRLCSFEVFLFVASLMIHQRLRDCYKQVNDINKRTNERFTQLEAELTKKVDAKLKELSK